MSEEFDIVVIGAGVGGCAAAARAIDHGLKVLILDIGSHVPSNSINEIDIAFVVDGHTKVMKIPAVQGAGGNSLIYGGHLARYPKHYWNESGDSCIPVDYEKITRYYDEILNKFNVNPRKFNESELRVKEAFEKAGFGSEEILWAISDNPSCKGCGGEYCQKSCKKNFFSVLCAPLISQDKLLYWPNSFLVDVSLLKDGKSRLKINRLGEEILVSAKFVVFSCGALVTPSEIVRLFGGRLDSTVINRIGHGMMFHISDFFILFPKFFLFKRLRTKLLCSSENSVVTDNQTVRFSIQSVGAELAGSTIYRYISRRYDYILFRNIFFKKLLLILSRFLAIPLSRGHVVASIVEDPSLFENYQNFNSYPITVNYRFQPSFANAIRKINRTIINNLKSKFFIIKFGGDSNLNFGHVMGGLPMGLDQSYLVDQNCKVKDLDNIFICDASILPCSAATNPSLTIAALGYHAVDNIVKILK